MCTNLKFRTKCIKFECWKENAWHKCSTLLSLATCFLHTSLIRHQLTAVCVQYRIWSSLVFLQSCSLLEFSFKYSYVTFEITLCPPMWIQSWNIVFIRLYIHAWVFIAFALNFLTAFSYGREDLFHFYPGKCGGWEGAFHALTILPDAVHTLPSCCMTTLLCLFSLTCP